MDLGLFYNRCPELANKETRVITLKGHSQIPDGDYGFIEYYCGDPYCDCRRVMITVMAKESANPHMATISFGFGSRDYYAKKIGEEHADDAASAILDPVNPQSEYAPIFLEIFQQMIRNEKYLDKIKQHYKAYRAAPSEKLANVPMNRAQRRAQKKRG